LLRHPPDILSCTTPESLYLMLTSAARETLRTVEYVIVDEIHASPHQTGRASVADARGDRPLRAENADPLPRRNASVVGDTAPLDEIARFLGGFSRRRGATVTIVDAGVAQTARRRSDRFPSNMSALAVHRRTTEWSRVGRPGAAARSGPASSPHLDLVMEHRSTIIFVNAAPRRALGDATH